MGSVIQIGPENLHISNQCNLYIKYTVHLKVVLFVAFLIGVS